MGRAASLVLALAIAACTPSADGRPSRVVADVPATADAGAHYLFHMHGSIVEDLGPAARGRYGQYRYHPTVEALADRGVIVISEVRGPTDPRAYAAKVAGQVARLRAAGVPPSHITVTGMSKGGSIAVLATAAIADPDVRFVVPAGCVRGGSFAGGFAAFGGRPQGRVLSMVDRADDLAGSCAAHFPAALGLRFEEIVFDLGRGHALFYGPERVWVDRMIDWALAP